MKRVEMENESDNIIWHQRENVQELNSKRFYVS